MDLQTQLYITMAGFVFFALMVTMYILAGRDILFALQRRFRPRGADIFMLNPNRHVDRFYKVPDDEGNFKIKGNTYITNPDKVGSLADNMKEKVEMSEEKRKEKLHKNIQRMVEKKNKALVRLDLMQKQDRPDAAAIAKVNEFIANMDDKINFLRSRLTQKEQSYFMTRRSVYFYIENDPVPKDMFEYLSEFDVIQLDNLIARAQSKDRQAAQDIEKTLKQLKTWMLILGGITLIAAWFAIKGSMGITDLAKAAGVTLTI